MTQELGFAIVKHLEQGVIEVIPHDGVEINLENMQDLQHLISEESAAICVLINHANKYSYTFDAMAAMRNLVDVKALAAVTDNYVNSKLATVVLGDYKKLQYSFEEFTDRDEAIHWLLSKK